MRFHVDWMNNADGDLVRGRDHFDTLSEVDEFVKEKKPLYIKIIGEDYPKWNQGD
jgi:hypothetical protein